MPLSLPRARHIIRRDRCHYLHGRGLSRQSGARGMGRGADFREHEKEIKGAEAVTTNNRMELTAAIRALAALSAATPSSCSLILSMFAKASPNGCHSGNGATGAPRTASR